MSDRYEVEVQCDTPDGKLWCKTHANVYCDALLAQVELERAVQAFKLPVRMLNGGMVVATVGR